MIRVLLICGLLAACSTPSALPEDFDPTFTF